MHSRPFLPPPSSSFPLPFLLPSPPPSFSNEISRVMTTRDMSICRDMSGQGCNMSQRCGDFFVPIPFLVAHDCGYPLSRYTCRATRVAADFLDFIAFCRCSTGVALHPLKILVSHLPPPPVLGGVAPKFGSEKVSRYTGVSQLQLRVSRYTVQLRSHSDWPPFQFCNPLKLGSS